MRIRFIRWVSVAAAMTIAPMAVADGNDGKPTAPQDLAAKVSQAYGVKVTVKDMEDGVPVALVKPIEKRFGKDKAKWMAVWKGHVAAFDKSWAAYEARKNAVDAAITSANDLAKDKKTVAEAKKVLLAVITPPKVDSDGKIDYDKAEILSPGDAEIPAIIALGKLYAADKDFVAATTIPQLIAGRRHVEDKDEERLIWLAYEKRSDMKLLGEQQKPPANEGVQQLISVSDRTFDSRRRSGATMAKAFPGLGPKFVEPYDAHDAKKGDWVFMKVEPTKITDKGMTFSDQGTYDVNVNCREGTELLGWDAIFSKWMYKTVCDTKSVTENVDLKVTFAKAPPAWSKGGDAVWVIGKVSSVGPKKWVLTDAGIADWRFLGLFG